jgi:glucosylceramidase
VLGFGGCFNELGWKVLSQCEASTRSAILQSLFDRESGCGFTWGRIPVGANDFALEWYSLNECADDVQMDHFSIERDRGCLIPYIREAQRIQPGLRFYASPWSPPAWMKFPRAYNWGKIRWEPQILQAYADYLLRFVQAYQAEKIPVEILFVQNEPDMDQKFPSCRWTGAELRDFIRDYAGPHFARSQANCDLWLGTFQRPDYNAWTNLVLSDPQARAFIHGVGYQWDGKYAVQQTHLSWPDFPILQTENECGDGQNTWEYALYEFNLIHHYFSNGVVGFMYWNLILPADGQSTWGGVQNAMINLDPAAGQVDYQPDYYVMRHLSQYIPPGSIRLGLQGSCAGNALAFETPERKTVIFAANPFSTPKELCYSDPHGTLTASLSPGSINTLIID